VHIDDEVLAHNGIPVENVAVQSDKPQSAEQPSVITFLRRELQSALEKEEYERAAILRDRLTSLNPPQSGLA
jgi:protein-arginine kinase activator protein McsA